MTNKTKIDDNDFLAEFNKMKSDIAELKARVGIKDVKKPKPLPILPHNNTPKRIDRRKNSF